MLIKPEDKPVHFEFCATCKYNNVNGNTEPCRSCFVWNNWRAKDD